MPAKKKRSREGGGKESGAIVALRLTDTLVKRADALISRVAESDIGALGETSRSTVLRLAVIRGLAALEEEYK